MIYLVTDRALCLGRDITEVVASAVRGGASMVQLREKDLCSRDFVELGRAVLHELEPYGVPLIINDRADIAQIIHAQGLHIGQGDLSYADARELLGADAIIGLSIENIEQAHQSAHWDLDYVAASPVFATSTKTDTAPALGLEGVRTLRQIFSCHITAIGGINLANIAEVTAAGADSVALVSAICSAEDPCEITKQLLEKCQRQNPIPYKR